MHVYVLLDFPDNDEGAVYCATLGEAHAAAREIEEVFRPNVRIYLRDIPTDKQSFISVLNHGGPHARRAKGEELPPPLRTWTLTSRGGLREIDP